MSSWAWPSAFLDNLGQMRKASKPVAVLVGIVVGTATTTAILVVPGSGKGDATGLKVARRGPVSLQYSSPWRTAQVINAVPYGLELASPVQLRKSYSNLWAGRIVAGSPVPGGLPQDIAANIHGAPARQRVDLNGVPVMRYSGVVDPGAARFILYVAATETSDFAILCAGATWSDTKRCERVMEGATVDSESAIQPGADASLSQQLDRLIEPLMKQSDLVSGLASATSITSVADAAQHLHRLYLNASGAVAELQGPPRYRRPIVSLANALTAEAEALQDLTEGAAHPDGAYGLAARAVEASSRDVLDRLRRLHRIGFSGLSLLPVFSIPPLRSLEAAPAVLGELVHEPQGKQEAPPVEAAEPEEDEWGSEAWEEAEAVGGSGGKEGGREVESEAEPVEPVESQGAR